MIWPRKLIIMDLVHCIINYLLNYQLLHLLKLLLLSEFYIMRFFLCYLNLNYHILYVLHSCMQCIYAYVIFVDKT